MLTATKAKPQTPAIRSEDSATAPEQVFYGWRNRVAVLAVSIFLLVPCFWHQRIEAGDLGSHVYNAWLAQLVHEGRAPGVYLVWQCDNILFDLLLFYFAKAFGLAVAQRMAVSLCVLIFFWGVFALMRAASGRAPWMLVPCIAMLTYSYIFHMGFMNYYLSLGLASIGLALVWRGGRNNLIAAVILAPSILLAHPLGFLWFLGASAYRSLWLRLRGLAKLLPLVLGLAVLLGARWFVGHHQGYEVEWRQSPFWQLNGTDQFHVFGDRYRYFSMAIGAFVLAATTAAWLETPVRRNFWNDRRLIIELYAICFAATALLPENLHTDPTGGWIGALVTRLSLVSAVFGLCWLASLPARRWHLLTMVPVAVVFFVFLYQDTGLLNRMEASAERVTRQLPFGTRTLATIFAPNDYRTIYLHVADRACIGHCFLVSNYEPSTRQFRVRVLPGSPVATASVDDSEDMQSGTYDVQEEDLPLKQLYQCTASDLTRICIRDLAEDEKNGRLGYHPVSNPFFSENP